MTQIRITTPLPADAEGIQTVLHKTWLSTYPNEEAGVTVEDITHYLKDAFSEETLQNVRGVIQNPTKNGLLLVAKNKNEVVGFCRIKSDANIHQLKAIYVLPEYQRQGIGKMLWNHVRLCIDNTKDMIVQVATYNTNAITFYTTLGFKDTGKKIMNEHFKMQSGAIIPEIELHLSASKKPRSSQFCENVV